MKKQCAKCNTWMQLPGDGEAVKYCKKCRDLMRKNGFIFCCICGEFFEYNSRTPSRRTCSDGCRKELQRQNQRKWDKGRKQYGPNRVQKVKPQNQGQVHDPFQEIDYHPGCPGAGHAQFSPVV